jgi:Gamma-glutamyltranspeptidase
VIQQGEPAVLVAAMVAVRPDQIAPGKRPFHTLVPAMVMTDGRPWLSLGVMGGDMQPQGHVQILLNQIEFHMNVQGAGEAARSRITEGGGARVGDRARGACGVDRARAPRVRRVRPGDRLLSRFGRGCSGDNAWRISDRFRRGPRAASRAWYPQPMPTVPWVIVYAGGAADTALLRDLLDAAGVPARLGDEVMGTMAPYVIAGGTTAAVKVLVPEDRLDDARGVVVEFGEHVKGEPDPGAPLGRAWECPCCHEANDGSFDICWNCQTERV